MAQTKTTVFTTRNLVFEAISTPENFKFHVKTTCLCYDECRTVTILFYLGCMGIEQISHKDFCKLGKLFDVYDKKFVHALGNDAHYGKKVNRECEFDILPNDAIELKNVFIEMFLKRLGVDRLQCKNIVVMEDLFTEMDESFTDLVYNILKSRTKD